MNRELHVEFAVRVAERIALENPGLTTLNPDHMNYFRTVMADYHRQMNGVPRLQFNAQIRLLYRYRIHRAIVLIGGSPRNPQSVAVIQRLLEMLIQN